MLAGRALAATATIARASAVSAFRAHDAFLSTAIVYHNLSGGGGENIAATDFRLSTIQRLRFYPQAYRYGQ